MQDCWSEDPNRRPTFNMILGHLSLISRTTAFNPDPIALVPLPPPPSQDEWRQQRREIQINYEEEKEEEEEEA